MKGESPILQWILLILAVLAVGVAGWQGWIQLAAQWGGRLLSQPVPIWVIMVFALLALGGVMLSRRRLPRPEIPRETIRIVPQPAGHRWHMGSVASRPAMQVVSDWFITNITNQPIHLVGAHITRPRTNGFVLVRHPQRNIYGPYVIPPGFTTEATADFWIQPPVRKVGQDFKATIVIVDQFGNKHAVRKVLFRSIRPPAPQQAEPPQESIHAIADPVEKQVVAVLKDEINRYRQVGRSTGGLGSIRTRYRGQFMAAFGTEWRRTDSPERQSLIPDPDQAFIESDNAAALLNLYQGLSSDEERSRFVGALLQRMSRGTEYTPIAYLIMLVLFRIGRLPDALRKAKLDLQGDSAMGFSDVLRLLDGLLRFEHPAFTPTLLDEVEQFVEDIQEHTFNIRERIAAIRAFRLASRPE